MKLGDITLIPIFRFDCWDKKIVAGGIRYSIGLCAEGLKRWPEGVFGTSRPLIGGTVLLDDYGRDFKVEPDLLHPDGVTAGESRIILTAIFEDMNRGGAYTDDWIWRPISLGTFLADHFRAPRRQRIESALLRCVDQSLYRGERKVS